MENGRVLTSEEILGFEKEFLQCSKIIGSLWRTYDQPLTVEQRVNVIRDIVKKYNYIIDMIFENPSIIFDITDVIIKNSKAITTNEHGWTLYGLEYEVDFIWHSTSIDILSSHGFNTIMMSRYIKLLCTILLIRAYVNFSISYDADNNLRCDFEYSIYGSGDIPTIFNRKDVVASISKKALLEIKETFNTFKILQLLKCEFGMGDKTINEPSDLSTSIIKLGSSFNGFLFYASSEQKQFRTNVNNINHILRMFKYYMSIIDTFEDSIRNLFRENIHNTADIFNVGYDLENSIENRLTLGNIRIHLNGSSLYCHSGVDAEKVDIFRRLIKIYQIDHVGRIYDILLFVHICSVVAMYIYNIEHNKYNLVSCHGTKYNKVIFEYNSHQSVKEFKFRNVTINNYMEELKRIISAKKQCITKRTKEEK